MFWGFGRKALTIVGLLLGQVLPGAAQHVTLQSADRSVQISGELLEFDGETYRIISPFGELTLNALGITCSGLSCPDPGQFAADITIGGNSAVVNDLLPGLIEDFSFRIGHSSLRKDHGSLGWTYFLADPARIPAARIQAKPSTSSRGLTELAAQQADLVVAARLANPPEILRAQTSGAGYISNPDARRLLALEGLIFIVSPENPVGALSLEQITQIYTGEITNWAELGGLDGPIRRLGRTAGSDIALAFQARFFPEESERILAPSITLGSDIEISTAIQHDPFAIGITGFAGIRNAKPLAIEGSCGQQQFPSAFSLQSGDYPLTRAYYLYASSQRQPIFTRGFLAFLQTDAAQRSITDLGYVGQAISSLAFSDQQNRAANAIAYSDSDVTLKNLKSFIQVFSDAYRLSATFRFGDNSKKIGPRSQRNIRALAEMIEVGDFDGQTLIFAGFSDAQGSAAGNRRISRQRAGQVAELVKAAASRADLSKVTIQVLGMGEVSPLACNSDAHGRHINRRVEVWLK